MNFWCDNKNYPERYFKYMDGNLYNCNASYDYKTYLPIGDWGEERQSTDYRKSYPADLYPYDFTYDIDADATLSQTLFNDDANFEYIMPIIELRSYTETSTVGERNSYLLGEEWFDQYKDIECARIIYKDRPVTTGFKVVDENGTVLQSVKFPDGYIRAGSYDSFSLDILNDKIYLEFSDLFKENELGLGVRNTVNLLYQVDGHGSGVKAPQIFKTGVRVSPTNVDRSQNVTVKLDNILDNACKVNVVSINGSTVYSTSIPAGCNATEINTSSFPSGMYVVNVHDGATVRENCKIIVR